jgi:hypothetical protein
MAGTLAGTLLGGVLGLVNTRMQLKTQLVGERRKLIVGKLEELHQVLSQFKQAFWDLSLMAGSHAAMEELIKQYSSIPADKLDMLVGFYAPELSASLKKIKQLSGEYVQALAQLVGWENKDEETRQGILSATASLKKKLDEACLEMQAGVITLARKYI